MTRSIEFHTAGRLHFGLTSFGGVGRQFGGLGVMVDGAGFDLKFSPAATFQATGSLSQRVSEFAKAFAAHQQLTTLPACHIEAVSNSLEHTGLGVGTQLGLAVAAGLAEWLGISWREATLLSQMAGRGERSAIGTYGFLHGGLLVDAGKFPDELLGQLVERVELPTDWRFVLIRHQTARGLAGPAEKQAIEALPPVPAETTSWLHNLIDTQILPAAREANWHQFSEALYRYGYRAGECFAPVQGGPFASSEISALVETIRDLGFPGVGQSSWGPTVFAVAADEQSAEGLVGTLKRLTSHQYCHFAIAQASNSGANICVVE